MGSRRLWVNQLGKAQNPVNRRVVEGGQPWTDSAIPSHVAPSMVTDMSTFTGFEAVWAERLGNLRNVVRQHVIAHQLAEHLGTARTALDVGCGQGTQTIQLARRGMAVTGVDPSSDLLARMTTAAEAAGRPVRAVRGTIDDLDDVIDDEQFDLVCAHGLLMYLPDAAAAIKTLAERLVDGGVLSFTVRNGDALAYRPGIRGDYRAALAAFEGGDRYRNELGVDAAAHSRAQIEEWCVRAGLAITAWYGVRVLTDGVPADTTAGEVDLDACLAAEVEAGRRDPYRAFGSQLHFLATRRPPQ